MSRLATRFASLRTNKTPGLVTYVTAGDPSPAVSDEILLAIAGASVDVLAVGVQFFSLLAARLDS